MNPVADSLLRHVMYNDFPKEDHPMNKIFKLSDKFPKVNLELETEFIAIKKQYISICRSIVEKTPQKLLLLTLFAANEQLMHNYRIIDSDILKMFAMWFSDVLNYLKYSLCFIRFYNNQNSRIYCQRMYIESNYQNC